MSDEPKEKKTKLPEEIWVRRNKKNMVTICLAEEQDLRVYPGLTRITDKKIIASLYNKKLNHAWVAMLANKTHELVSKPSSTSGKNETTVFTAMVADKALELVKETFSIPALEAMYADEETKKSRKSVLQAILDQIEEVRTPDKAGEGNAA